MKEFDRVLLRIHHQGKKKARYNMFDGLNKNVV